jgi:hypothetical protein
VSSGGPAALCWLLRVRDLLTLTSARTFSGAEEFAYNLQTQKRARIVGETTGVCAVRGSASARNKRSHGWNTDQTRIKNICGFHPCLIRVPSVANSMTSRKTRSG